MRLSHQGAELRWVVSLLARLKTLDGRKHVSGREHCGRGVQRLSHLLLLLMGGGAVHSTPLAGERCVCGPHASVVRNRRVVHLASCVYFFGPTLGREDVYRKEPTLASGDRRLAVDSSQD